jgi:hypothetical protein
MRAAGIALFIWAVTIAIALLGAYGRYTHARESQSWPTVPGVVETARVDKVGPRYWPRFTYAYQVGGVDHHGFYARYLDLMNDNFSHGSQDPQWANDRVARFSVGEQVTVHYNPAMPWQSWLEYTPISLWQCVPLWGFFLQFIGACVVMQRLAVTRKAWLFIPALVGVFVLWVCFFIAMRPPD